MVQAHKQSQHKRADIPYHLEWAFKKEAFIWCGEKPVRINFHPAATELKEWLSRCGDEITLFSESEKEFPTALTNPYSYSASTIISIFTKIVSATHEFANSNSFLDDTEAEIERIRLYNEQVLYTARVCEVTIKQLLYCTQIDQKLYRNAPLGRLLALDCRPCRKAKSPHLISLLGSLAHRYNLCLPIEKCLMEHLKIVNRRRKSEAAHSEAELLKINGVDHSRAQLMRDSKEIGEELLHMLVHISEIEQEMMKDLQRLCLHPFEAWS